MFRFANSEFLYLLALIPVCLLLFILAARGKRKRLARFGNPELVRGLMPMASRGRHVLKFILLMFAFASLIVALARPQYGSKLREQKSEGVEMMLVVDVSNSMLADDFEPNRLERTKYAINQLFDGLQQQERVGLVAFAGEAAVQLPITSDYRMAKAFASRLDPTLVAEQGTNIGRALELALLSFSSESESSRVIILITDGEDHEQRAVAAAERAKELGVRIYTIGIGTPQGAPIRIDGDFITDENGEMVVSKLNEEMLTTIATTTEGGYVRASKQELGLKQITDSIAKMEQSELSVVQFEEYNEYYQYLIALALLFLLLEFYVLGRKNMVLERFNIFREERDA